MSDSASASFFTGLDENSSSVSSIATPATDTATPLVVTPTTPTTDPFSLPTPIATPTASEPSPFSAIPAVDAPVLPGNTTEVTPLTDTQPFVVTQHTFPSVEEMLAELDQSGILLPELETQAVKNLDTSPLAALQPTQLNPADTFFSTPLKPKVTPLPGPSLGTSSDESLTFSRIIMSGGVMLAASILAVQVVQHLVQLLHFVMINYPQLQNEIMFHQASSSIINQYAVKAVGLFALSIISLIGSLFLLFNREHPALKWFLGVAVGAIILNFVTEQYLVKPQFHFANPAGFQELRKVLTSPELSNDGSFTVASPEPYSFEDPPNISNSPANQQNSSFGNDNLPAPN
jgi:hypothetical protein